MCFVRFLPCNHKRITSGMGRNYNHMSDGPSLGLGNEQLEKLTVRSIVSLASEKAQKI